MFNLANFVADCRSAVEADPTHLTAHEITRRAFSGPSSVLAAVGEPRTSGLVPIYKSKNLTIINVVWKPGMTVMPHNHAMWAVIGIYGGREGNIFGVASRTTRRVVSRLPAPGLSPLET